ncbi:isochorismatase hydrolase [Caballeronia hypogeia]|uniref:Isochorismatase hydrolase n=1 Tax=Caballeronia hypogeia TaxID=1777140 RepID=A0A158BNB7_9BURK|nr:isochorismatase family protein [Caballeronia hypogeia]SAK71226.1 isochorismatase hydrolase [Caballeronia hypogeia]
MKQLSFLKRTASALVVLSALGISQHALAENATMNAGNSITASENTALKKLKREDTVLLLVDHQVGLFTGVTDISTSELKHNLVALAKAARVLGIPVIVTATMPDGMWGPTIPELRAALPDVPVIVRGTIDAWQDPAVQSAIKKTGRHQLLVAGVSTEICASLPALSAKADGYDSRVVIDASGTFSEAKKTAGLARLQMAGIPIVDYATAAVEMLGSNDDPKAHDVYGALDIPFAGLVYNLQQAFTKKK